MKKKIIISVIIICMLATACACLVACKKPLTNLQKLENQVSAIQTKYIVGANDDFNISITTCKQEEVFIADGKVGKLKSQTTLVAKPKNVNLINKQFDFKLIGDKATLDGKLSKSRVGVELCVDIENLDSLGKLSKVSLTTDGKSQDVTLTDKLVGMITPQRALQSAYEKFQTEIDTLMENKKFEKEVYIKVIEDKQVGGENCYWFVSFIQSKEDYWSALIDIKDGKVLTSKVHNAQPVVGDNGKIKV